MVWMRNALFVGLAALVLVVPTAHAEDGGVVVRAKPGPDLERMAHVLIGQDAKAAQAMAAKVKALTAPQIKILMRHVRRLARAVQPASRQPLDDQRAIVMITAHVLEAPRNFLRDVGVDNASKRPTAKQPVTYLDATAYEVILRAMKKSETIQVTSAPRIAAFDRQRANVSVINQVSYVQDYEIEITNGASLADPVVGIVQEGVMLDITPTVSTDGKFVTIEFDGTWASLKRPIADMEITLGGHKVAIQLPEVVTSKVNITTTMPDGAAALIGGGELIERDGVPYQRLVLLQVTKTEMTEIKKAEGDNK